MINKIVSIKDAASHIHNEDTIMLGGFGNYGAPNSLIAEIGRQGRKDLTVISEYFSFSCRAHIEGLRPLIYNKCVKHFVCSFCGDDEVVDYYNRGEFTIEFIPQGTLAERIRAAGCGIGGFYTPTGVGTIVEEGKEKRIIDGKEYILEKPLSADVALIKAHKADQYGNAVCKYVSRNFNPVMAMAGKTVILEADEIVELGELDPDVIHIPGVFVDYVVKTEDPEK